jgi:hypothetical protein
MLKILFKEAESSLNLIFTKAFSEGNKKFEIEDAVILGDFEQLCRKLNLYEEYELVFRILSSEVHSMDVLKRWHFEPNKIYIFDIYINNDMNISIVKYFLLDAINDLY